MWGMRILFSLQVVPQIMQLTFSLLYDMSNFHLCDVSLWYSRYCKSHELSVIHTRQAAGRHQPSGFQLNLWLNGLPVRLVSPLSQKTQVIFREGMEAWLVSFITRMYRWRHKPNTFHYLTQCTLSLVTLECCGLEGMLARNTHPQSFSSPSSCAGFSVYNSVCHTQVQTSWTVYWTIIE